MSNNTSTSGQTTSHQTPPTQNTQSVVFLQLAAGMATFGSATPISKIVTQAMPVFIGSVLRVTLGALVLLPFMRSRWHKVRQIERKDWIILSLIAVFGMFGFSALMLYGMRQVSGVTGAIVMSTAPAVTAAASMLFMGDTPTWRKFLAIALAVAGVVVLRVSGSGSVDESAESIAWFGVALVFAAVCCEAAYTLLGKKISDHVDPLLVSFLASALSIPLFVPFAVWQWTQFYPSAVDISAWLALLWYGAGTLALGSVLWYSGVAKAEGSVAAVFMGIMPVSALVLSYVLLGEAFMWSHLLGFSIVFAGVLVISWEHATMAKQDQS